MELSEIKIKEIYLEQYKNILEEFNINNINYCVLRNYEFALEGGENYPLERHFDMVISGEDMSKVNQIMKKYNAIKYPPQFSKAHQGQGLFVPKENIKVGFDIQNDGIYWNDIQYLSATQIMPRRVKKGFFYVLSKEDDFIMYLCHSILGKRRFKEKYKQILSDLGKESLNWEYIFDNLKRIFNRKYAKELIILVKKQDFKHIQKKIPILVPYFIVKHPKNIFTFTSLSFRWFFSRRHTPLLKIPIIRYIVPGTPMISIIGPDGSGKSTMAKNLETVLQERFFAKVKLVYSGRGKHNFIPIKNVGDIYKKKEKKELEKNPKTGKIKSVIIYTLAAPIYTLDLLLRYLFKIMPLRKRHTFIITDRYCSDLLLMNNVPFFIKRILISFFPKPTLTFYLHNTLKELSTRRPNHSVKDLDRQLYLFTYLEKHFNAVSILTTDAQKDFEFASEIMIRKLIYLGY